MLPEVPSGISNISNAVYNAIPTSLPTGLPTGIPVLGSILSLGIVVLAIVLLVFIVAKIGKIFVKIVVGIVANTVLGFLVLYAMGYFFKITIVWTSSVILSVVLFGLPAVGTLLILKVVGGIALMIL